MLRRGNSNKCRKRSRSRRSVRKMTCDGWHARVTTRQPAQPAWGLKEAHNTGDRWQAGWLNGEGRSREVDISDLSIFKMCFLTGWTRKAGNGSRRKRTTATKSISRQMSVWTMTRKGDHGGRGGVNENPASNYNQGQGHQLYPGSAVQVFSGAGPPYLTLILYVIIIRRCIT